MNNRHYKLEGVNSKKSKSEGKISMLDSSKVDLKFS